MERVQATRDGSPPRGNIGGQRCVTVTYLTATASDDAGLEDRIFYVLLVFLLSVHHF